MTDQCHADRESNLGQGAGKMRQKFLSALEMVTVLTKYGTPKNT